MLQLLSCTLDLRIGQLRGIDWDDSVMPQFPAYADNQVKPGQIILEGSKAWKLDELSLGAPVHNGSVLNGVLTSRSLTEEFRPTAVWRMESRNHSAPTIHGREL